LVVKAVLAALNSHLAERFTAYWDTMATKPSASPARSSVRAAGNPRASA
jgi:hypothetical protein